MYTQLFGGYLLNRGILTTEQLACAMEKAKQTRVKLGVLAINAGFMTAAQVDRCHELQLKQDRRMGDIAVAQGFMTDDQVQQLLKSQKSGYLVLGQAIMDHGYMDNAAFEAALADYKRRSTISDVDMIAEDEEKEEQVLRDYYSIGAEDASDGVTKYISLLMKNLVRFIGSDFSLLRAERTKMVSTHYTVSQKIRGIVNLSTAVCMDDGVFLSLASRYAGEEIRELDEFAQASVGEFLNLHNGLFAVNMSQQSGVELELEPQIIHEGGVEGLGGGYVIPVQFSFGVIWFVVTCR